MKLLLAVSSLIWTEAVSRESLSILSRSWFVLDRKFWDTLLRTSSKASSFERFQEGELVINDDSDPDKFSPIPPCYERDVGGSRHGWQLPVGGFLFVLSVLTSDTALSPSLLQAAWQQCCSPALAGLEQLSPAHGIGLSLSPPARPARLTNNKKWNVLHRLSLRHHSQARVLRSFSKNISFDSKKTTHQHILKISRCL